MSTSNSTLTTKRPDVLFNTLGWLSTLPVAWIVILTFADVFGRYVFASPVRGSVEMIEFAMAMVIFTALPLITRQRSHVTVSLIDGMVTGLGRKIKQVMCDAVSALALGVLTWRLYLQGKDDLESGSATVVLSLPHAPLSLAMAFFTAFSTLMILGLMIRTFKETGDTV